MQSHLGCPAAMMPPARPPAGGARLSGVHRCNLRATGWVAVQWAHIVGNSTVGKEGECARLSVLEGGGQQQVQTILRWVLGRVGRMGCRSTPTGTRQGAQGIQRAGNPITPASQPIDVRFKQDFSALSHSHATRLAKPWP